MQTKIEQMLPSVYHPIDCSIAENYIPEHARMCTSYDNKPSCNGCEIVKMLKPLESCERWRQNNPQKAIEIVQQWSDEHPTEPVATYLDRFKTAFPNAVLRKSGAPKLCLQQIQYVDCFGNCFKCWNQPYKENDK